MLTNEKVLEVFKDYLSQYPDYEVVMTSHGYTFMGWNTGIYNMIHTLSENVMMPIAGLILAFVMTLELIQIIVDKNQFSRSCML